MDQQNGIIRQYDITLTELETGSLFSYVTASTNFTITLLHPDYNYQIEISAVTIGNGCLLYTSPSPRDATLSRMPSSA